MWMEHGEKDNKKHLTPIINKSGLIFGATNISWLQLSLKPINQDRIQKYPGQSANEPPFQIIISFANHYRLGSDDYYIAARPRTQKTTQNIAQRVDLIRCLCLWKTISLFNLICIPSFPTGHTCKECVLPIYYDAKNKLILHCSQNIILLYYQILPKYILIYGYIF